MNGQRIRYQQTEELHFLTFRWDRRRLPPRSPKARDRGHPQLVRIPLENGATRQSGKAVIFKPNGDFHAAWSLSADQVRAVVVNGKL